jgi:hypothetical protein
MKKLRLDLNELQVEAFPTTKVPTDKRGTVFGHSENVNCGNTAEGGLCWYSGDGCITWSLCYQCDHTYGCNTGEECGHMTH